MPRIFSPENWMENSVKFTKNFRFKSCVRKLAATRFGIQSCTPRSLVSR